MYTYIKRGFDFLIAAILLILLLPLFLLISLWIMLDSSGPVLFHQRRWGRNRTQFECLKFRTMTIEAPSDIATRDLTDSKKYITFSGRFLRRLGLDELPQLINVLRGEMSLIGPRPVMIAERSLINERDKYGANAMTPGIGGWAQSNGRDELDDKAKARLDGEYTQNFGLRMDTSCLLRTAVAIFTSKGFKEGGFGDDDYREQVKRKTHRVEVPRRRIVYSQASRKRP